MNLQKYRQIQLALENAEERAEIAENSLMKLRTKSRNASVIPRNLANDTSAQPVAPAQ